MKEALRKYLRSEEDRGYTGLPYTSPKKVFHFSEKKAQYTSIPSEMKEALRKYLRSEEDRAYTNIPYTSPKKVFHFSEKKALYTRIPVYLQK